MKKREAKHKRKSAVVAGVAAIALLLTGTFAWSDYSQHKTNEATANASLYKARLIENFDPDSTRNWKISDPLVTKEISVLNPAKETDADNGIYGDVYVRLQFKEFLEFYENTYVYTEDRYMTDASGQFYEFDYDDYAGAEAKVAEIEALYGNGPHKIEQVRMHKTSADIEDDKLPWYIQTKESDPNGIYGAFILLDIEVDLENPTNIIETNPPARASEDQKKAADGGEHDEHNNGECDYTVHTWINGIHDCAPNAPNTGSFHDYIQWIMGPDVITIDEWDGTAAAKWILDTTSTEGWVYWGQALAPQQETANVLEQMLLLNQPDESFYYALHTDMQAVSFDELDLWTDAPEAVIDAYQKIDSMVITPALTSVKRGTTKQFKVTVNTDALSTDVTWTLEPTTNGSSVDADGLVTISATEVAQELIVTATSVSDPSKSVSATIIVASDLPETMLDLTGTTADIGKRFEADGYKWRVLQVDDAGNILITAADTTGLPTGVTFYTTTTTSEYVYSNLEAQMDVFYRNLKQNGTILSPLVQPVKLAFESGTDITTDVLTASASGAISEVVPESAGGERICFALSASEINTYMMSDEKGRGFDNGNGTYWTRTPFNTDAYTNRAVYVTNGNYGNTSGTSGYVLRPAMWININDLIY